MEGGNAVENRMSQRFLKIIALGAGKFDNLGAKEVVVPRLSGQILRRRGKIIEPDLDANQQSLRRTNLKLMKADIGLHLERLENDSRRPHLEISGNEAAKFGLDCAHLGPRNWTSRSRLMKRWPESMVITWPVTAVASTR